MLYSACYSSTAHSKLNADHASWLVTVGCLGKKKGQDKKKAIEKKDCIQGFAQDVFNYFGY
jgi:hypothetical protein